MAVDLGGGRCLNKTTDDVAGWVASGAEFDEMYLQLDGVCADIPAAPAAP